MWYAQKHAHKAGDGSTALPIMLKEYITDSEALSSVILYNVPLLTGNTDITLVTVTLHAFILN